MKGYYIFEKRQRWNVHLDGVLVAKFTTEDEAKEYSGWVPPVPEQLQEPEVPSWLEDVDYEEEESED